MGRYIEALGVVYLLLAWPALLSLLLILILKG
jgi:hypothetical protein